MDHTAKERQPAPRLSPLSDGAHPVRQREIHRSVADLLHHQNLRLSPLGVVSQHDRRPRIICDYTYSGVNAATQHTGPQEAMRFGQALRRIMTQIVRSNPAFGPVHIGKYDLADGYYRIPLNPHHAIRLACLLPTAPTEDSLSTILLRRHGNHC